MHELQALIICFGKGCQDKAFKSCSLRWVIVKDVSVAVKSKS